MVLFGEAWFVRVGIGWPRTGTVICGKGLYRQDCFGSPASQALGLERVWCGRAWWGRVRSGRAGHGMGVVIIIRFEGEAWYDSVGSGWAMSGKDGSGKAG